MFKTHPIPIAGSWTEGWALDLHTVSSRFVLEEADGYREFDTERSALGEALNDFKYYGRRSRRDELAAAALQFLDQKKWPVELLLIVPPSRRRWFYQPLAALAKRIAADYRIPWLKRGLRKVRRTAELKDVEDVARRTEILAGAFRAHPKKLAGKTVLLFDDVYRSGASADAAARAILEQGRAAALYFLALTKTRSKR